jgi:hypothetical protein
MCRAPAASTGSRSRGAFGYHLANGVTIVVEATKSKTATTDAIAFDMLREVTKYVTPATPLDF